MIIHDHEQYSAEWWQARLGIPTASGVDKLITSTGAPSKQAAAYANTLIAERLSGRSDDSVSTVWTERGRETEGEAREMLELVLDQEITEVGFITTDDRTIGCSPDGVILSEGSILEGVEIKCPKGSTHVEYLRAGKVPPKYLGQVQTCLYVTGASAWWFCSYYPGIDPLILRVEPDLEWHGKLEEAVQALHQTIEQSIKTLENKSEK